METTDDCEYDFSGDAGRCWGGWTRLVASLAEAVFEVEILELGECSEYGISGAPFA